MILPVFLYGQAVLRQKAEDVAKDYPEIKKLVADMYDTMYHADGVGLAAPQIGLSIRLLVIDANVLGDDFPECVGFKRTMINPDIIEKSEEEILLEEGCLSIPGISEKVSRAKVIKVKYLDEDFVEHEETIGKVFIDNISAIRRQLNKGKINSILKGTVKCSYRAKAVGK